MSSGLTVFAVALGMVVLAEMGDKTQLLAMCFATRFEAKKVLAGVFIATILNHALAVAAGYFLREVLASYSTIIELVASVSFIGFALWTIRGDSVDESCDSRSKYGPVITVAIAFFIAEMGDKTQLATVSIAAGFSNPVAVLIGTTTGMLIADGIGIIIGVVMNKKIPENIVKWISAAIFAICGLAGYIASGRLLMNTWLLAVTTVIIMLVSVLIAVWIVRSGTNSRVYEEIPAMKEDPGVNNMPQ